VGDVIPLFRLKALSFDALRGRFETIEKAPPKARDMRSGRPGSRFEGREQDPMSRLGALKDLIRPRRFGKLRFFRVFKLLVGVKAATHLPVLRELDERYRKTRWLRRL
jgi:hypothetical protein